MKHFITILSVFFFSANAFSQIGSVKGVAFDTSVNQAVHNATIIDLIQKFFRGMRTQVLHFNCGKLKLSVKDLLNQNTGINRNANQNYIEDSRVNSLRRFFLLSFTYNLTKTGLTYSNNGGMRMIR